jgi:histidinol-phosphate phosphatase family protein
MKKEYIAVIQAGGKGTRMVEMTKDLIPKPMLMLNGKPMIQWQIENLIEYGIKDICIITGHLGEKIEEYFKDGSGFGANITYVRENEPLGSAGALYYVGDIAGQRDIILVFGDVMMKLDWNRAICFHEAKEALATLLIHPNSHPYDSDLVITDDKDRITGIDSKNNIRDYWYENQVNAGIYILDNEILGMFEAPMKKDLEKDVLKPLIGNERIYGYHTTEYVKDAGTPRRFMDCAVEQAEGIWDAKCLCKRQRSVFIDRDGTLNKFKGLISEEEQLELEENAARAVKFINSSGYLAICITNQPVVARGMCEISDIKNIHKKLQTLLGQQGAYLDDIVFCPHHPDKGYPEENPLYKVKCDCRKPAIGMIEQMAAKYNIDLSESFIIGDSTVDIQTGINAGLHTVLVKTGQRGEDGKYNVTAEFVAQDLLDAVEKILGE